MTHLLDSDHVTFLQRGNGPECAAIVRHIQQTGQANVAVSIISFHEQFMGLHSKLNQARKPSDLVVWYRRMADLLDLYSRVNLIVFDDAASVILNRLRTTPKLPIKPMDLRIAAIGLANDLTLVTRNNSDFSRIPNLKLEDWTK